MAEWYKRIPNWLTFLRLLLIPVFVLALREPGRAMLNFAAAVFLIAAITDYADGILARRYGAVSNFGKLLDPLADKILVMAALVMLVGVRDERCVSLVPAWMVVLILGREFWVTGLRAVAASEGVVVAATSGGKVKSFLQMVAILAILMFDYSFEIAGQRFTWHFAGLNLLLLSVVFSVLSAIDYTILILAPQKGGLSELTRRLGGTLLPEAADSGASGAESKTGAPGDGNKNNDQ